MLIGIQVKVPGFGPTTVTVKLLQRTFGVKISNTPGKNLPPTGLPVNWALTENGKKTAEAKIE
ncbi:MAG: hypothetical protein M1383_05460 [Patescibacteria group bacterium]|nr:hypothetical protein [Patescibacteria group bacterium]